MAKGEVSNNGGAGRAGGVGSTNKTESKNDASKEVSKAMDKTKDKDIKATASNVVRDSLAVDNFKAATKTHTVQKGDTLSHIARDNGLSLGEVVAANPSIKDPNRIYPGQEINLTPGAAKNGPQQGITGNVPVPTPNPARAAGVLARGANGQQVRDLQTRLNELGYSAGPVDGAFGPMTQSAVRRFQTANELNASGRVDTATNQAMNSPEARRAAEIQPGEYPNLEVYPPGSPEQVALFEEAARRAGVPESWASDPGLLNVLRRESGGRVGVPNYTYGRARTQNPESWGQIHNELRQGRISSFGGARRSSATGLGQLLLGNVDRYYPGNNVAERRAGIGDPMSEAIGMLSYIQDRHGTPGQAWANYNTAHEGY